MITLRRNRSVPSLNTTSTADISFMLLIFFLVTSSMNVDKGLARVLPPSDKQEQSVETLVERDQLLTITVTADNRFLVNDQPAEQAALRQLIADFVAQRGADHLIMIDASPQATYEIYFEVQNALVAAYRDVRERMARQTYGRSYELLTEQQRDAIREKCPQRIAEQSNKVTK